MGLPLLSSALWDPSHSCELRFALNLILLYFAFNNILDTIQKGKQQQLYLVLM